MPCILSKSWTTRTSRQDRPFCNTKKGKGSSLRGSKMIELHVYYKIKWAPSTLQLSNRPITNPTRERWAPPRSTTTSRRAKNAISSSWKRTCTSNNRSKEPASRIPTALNATPLTTTTPLAITTPTPTNICLTAAIWPSGVCWNAIGIWNKKLRSWECSTRSNPRRYTQSEVQTSGEIGSPVPLRPTPAMRTNICNCWGSARLSIDRIPSIWLLLSHIIS